MRFSGSSLRRGAPRCRADLLTYILDTNALSALMKGSARVVERLAVTTRADVAIPQPVMAEIAFGLERLPRSKRRYGPAGALRVHHRGTAARGMDRRGQPDVRPRQGDPRAAGQTHRRFRRCHRGARARTRRDARHGESRPHDSRPGTSCRGLEPLTVRRSRDRSSTAPAPASRDPRGTSAGTCPSARGGRATGCASASRARRPGAR